MIGLEYIRTLYGDTTTLLAEKLNISNVNISHWENQKKIIPPKRLAELSAIYNLPETLFQKELTKSEELQVKYQKLSDEYSKSIIEYATTCEGDKGIEEALRMLEIDIKVEKTIEKIRNTIYNSNINYDDEFTNSDSVINTQEQNLGLFNKFNLLMQENNSIFLAYILRAVELSYDDSWGENPRLDKNGLTGKVLNAICEWKEEEKKKREDEYQEYKELFGLDEE